jgi:AcrR family transcriptional regulator
LIPAKKLDQLPSPARRADAERNRANILAAARSAFADPRTEVSMAEVSRRAGVGMATLYRNFPGRRELLEALYIDEVDAVCEAAETLEAETPGALLSCGCIGFSFSSPANILSAPSCSNSQGGVFP